MNQPQAEFLDLYRSGLKNAVDLMKSSLASAERLQNQQMSAIRSALDHYWSIMCQAAGENQMATVTQVQQQMAQARDWFNETYAMTARATEEAAKLAAAQVASANAGMRMPKQERKSA